MRHQHFHAPVSVASVWCVADLPDVEAGLQVHGQAGFGRTGADGPGDFPHAGIAGIGYVQISQRIEREPRCVAQQRRRRRSTVAGEARLKLRARDHLVAALRAPIQQMLERIGDEDPSGVVRRQTRRTDQAGRKRAELSVGRDSQNTAIAPADTQGLLGYVEVSSGVEHHAHRKEKAEAERGDHSLRIDHPHAAGKGFGNVQVAAAIERYSLRSVQRGAGCRTTVGGRTGQGPAPSHSRNHPEAVHPADATVPGVGDEYIAGGVNRKSRRPAKQGGSGRTAVAGVPQPGTGESADGPVGRDAANAVSAAIGDVQVARGVEGYGGRYVQGGGGRRTTVARDSELAVSGNRVDDAGDDPPQAGIIGVGDYQVAGRVHGHGLRLVQRARSRHAAVAEKIGLPVSREGGDRAVWSDAADAVRLRIGEVQVAGAVYSQPDRPIDGSLQCRTTVTAVAARTVAGHRADHTLRRDLANPAAPELANVQVAGAIHGQPVWLA